MGEWYPIVHGRTAFVDFRSNLIVVPEFFDDRALEWAKRHILSTTRRADRLPGLPRWSVFQTPDVVVGGVTCMAREVSAEMTSEMAVVNGREVERRPLYVFLGYAARRPVDGLPPRELELFAPLYRFVKARWREEWHDSRQKHLSVHPDRLPESPAGAFLDLNVSDEVVVIHPHSHADRLWAAAATHPRASLCLGLPTAAEAVAGAFHNVTLQDQEFSGSFRREPLRPQQRPERPRHQQPVDARDDFREAPRPWAVRAGWGCPMLNQIVAELSSAFGSLQDLIFGSDRHDPHDRRGGDEPRDDPYDVDRHDGRGATRETERGPADEHRHYHQHPHPRREETRPPRRDGHASAHPRERGAGERPSVPTGFARSRPDAPKPRGSTWGGWDEGSVSSGSTPLKIGPEAAAPRERPPRPDPLPAGPPASHPPDGGPTPPARHRPGRQALGPPRRANPPAPVQSPGTAAARGAPRSEAASSAENASPSTMIPEGNMPTFQEWRDEVLKLYGQADAFTRGRGAAADAFEAGAARLREGRFTVVVAGEFKQGKSSLLTAFLEEPGLFPVDLDITTNLVTTAAWAPEERITVLLGEPGRETVNRISRDEIPGYVTEQRNPTRTRTDQARMLVVETPNPRLREGLVLVDTPGVGGVEVGHTDITYAIIPNADAVVFTTDALAPLTTDELDFVRRIAEHTRLLLFAITKIDAKHDWEAIVTNNRAKLAVTLDRLADDLIVVPVSSRLKLDHLRAGDPDALADSNFPALEEALWRLIAENRGFVVVVRALQELDAALEEVERPFKGEFEGYAQTLQADAQKRVSELERPLRQKEARVAELLDRNASWRRTLRNGMQRIREDSHTVLSARLKDLRRRAAAYLDDPRRLREPATIVQALEADANSAIVLTGNALSEKAAVLHRALVTQMGLDLDGFQVETLRLEEGSLDLLGLAPRRTGTWEKTVELTRSASFSAGAGSTVLGVLGAAVGGILGFFVGGVGAGPGAQLGFYLGAGLGSISGASTGWRRRLREIRERDDSATRRAVGPLVHSYLDDVETGARELLLNALRALEDAVEVSVDGFLRREQRTLAATREAFEKARAATHADAAREMGRLRAPLAELARLRARCRALVERIGAERDDAASPAAVPEAAAPGPAGR